MKLFIGLALVAMCLATTKFDDNFSIKQQVADSAIAFTFTYTGDDIGSGVWFGIVLGQESMTDADIILCWVDTDSTAGCGDYYSESSSVPQADSATSHVSLGSSEISDDKAEIVLARVLDTQDSQDTALTDGETITYGFAYGPYSSGTLSAATTTGSVESTVGNAVYMTLTVLAVTVFGMML